MKKFAQRSLVALMAVATPSCVHTLEKDLGKTENKQGSALTSGFAKGPLPPMRQIASTQLGGMYCLRRTVPDGSGGSQNVNLPVRHIMALSAWETINRAPLGEIKHHTNCGPVPPQEKWQLENLWIGPGLTLHSSGPSRGLVRTLESKDGYLYSRHVDCPAGSSCNGTLNDMDVYVYALDILKTSEEPMRKFLVVDLFHKDSINDMACHLERLEHALSQVESWSDCSTTLQVDLSKSIDVLLGTLQTGSGGGYEPP